jgi:hypothetical protein
LFLARYAIIRLCTYGLMIIRVSLTLMQKPMKPI